MFPQRPSFTSQRRPHVPTRLPPDISPGRLPNFRPAPAATRERRLEDLEKKMELMLLEKSAELAPTGHTLRQPSGGANTLSSQMLLTPQHATQRKTSAQTELPKRKLQFSDSRIPRHIAPNTVAGHTPAYNEHVSSGSVQQELDTFTSSELEKTLKLYQSRIPMLGREIAENSPKPNPLTEKSSPSSNWQDFIQAFLMWLKVYCEPLHDQ